MCSMVPGPSGQSRTANTIRQLRLSAGQVSTASNMHKDLDNRHNEGKADIMCDLGSSNEDGSAFSDLDSNAKLYEPLSLPQAIRILCLNPGQWNDPLRCSLKPVDLGTAPAYEAVSYAWGDESERAVVWCDGSALSVTRNLFEALQVYRRRDRVRYLWADAICIDQVNVSERNHQVQLMAEIFSGASRVLVWLGPGDFFSIQVAFDFACRHVNRYCREYLRDGEVASYRWRGAKRAFSDGESKSRPSKAIGRCTVLALTQLFSCPYFRRGWVIQEIALSKTAEVHWGHGRISVHWLGHLAYFLLTTLDYEFCDDLAVYEGLRDFDSMFTILKQTQGSARQRTFGDLLEKTRGALFKDPRDRIFGMLGLQSRTRSWSSGLASALKPDYDASLLQCFKTASDTLLVDNKDLIILALVQHDQDIEEDWPSYVPHFDQWLIEDLSYQHWRCSGGSVASVSKSSNSDKDCLVLQGFRVDTIASIIGGYESSSSDVDLQGLLQRLFQQFDLERAAWSATAGRTTGDIDDAFIDLDFNARHLEEFTAFLSWNLATHGPLEFGSQDPTVQRAVGFYEESKGIVRGRKFFETSSSLLGLGHRIVQPGDVVAIFFGGNTPFVLRAVNGLWRLIGVCYVYGIMEGQAYSEWQNTDQLPEDFYIY